MTRDVLVTTALGDGGLANGFTVATSSPAGGQTPSSAWLWGEIILGVILIGTVLYMLRRKVQK